MPFEKSVLLALPVNERLALAEELWSSVEDEFHKDSTDEIVFANERLKLHLEEPESGYSVDQLKNTLAISMEYKLLIKPIVFIDVEDAYLFYEKKVMGLGKRFYQQVFLSLNNIEFKPLHYSFVAEPVRRHIVKGFPYKVYFIVEKESVIVLGIVHVKRSNQFLKKEVEKLIPDQFAVNLF